MMDNITYNKLYDAILKKTKSGLLSWVSTSYEACYQTDLGKGAVAIMYDPEPDGNFPPDYTPPIAYIKFLNERGEVFFSKNCYLNNDSELSKLKELFEIVESTYMKVDETIKSMFEDLNSTPLHSDLPF